MKYKKLLSIPVISVYSLMGFIYYITVFIFIEDWIGLQTSAGFLNAIIFTSIASLCLFSFLVAVLTEPGIVPSNYIPDVEDNSFDSDQKSNKKVLQSRFCNKCAAYKPPRTHHCRICNRCILKMDHHCLWINNCVGYWNYKAYFNLILYATISSIHSTVIVMICSCQKDWSYNGTLLLKPFYVTCGAMLLVLSLTFGSLLGWHIYLVTHDTTTIEYYEGIQAAWLAKKSGLSYRHQFDISVDKNITSVLGPDTLKWFFPTSTSHLKDELTSLPLESSSSE